MMTFFFSGCSSYVGNVAHLLYKYNYKYQPLTLTTPGCMSVSSYSYHTRMYVCKFSLLPHHDVCLLVITLTTPGCMAVSYHSYHTSMYICKLSLLPHLDVCL